MVMWVEAEKDAIGFTVEEELYGHPRSIII